MAQALQPVRIQSQWFKSGYARGVAGVKGMPTEPTEQAVVGIVERILSIYQDDGEISQEQLRFECGLLVGYLLRPVG